MLALPALLHAETAPSVADAARASNPLAPRPPHFPAKAKHIIHVYLNGGPSQVDTWDPKPDLTKWGGQKLPVGNLTTERETGFALASPFKFAQYGQSGLWCSEIFEKTASQHADKICVIRSMTAKVGVHATATYLMRTGYEPRGTIKHPMLGAWAQNFLGASHETLPSSVCINHGSEHGNGFFPATFTPLPIIDPDAGLQYATPSAGIATLSCSSSR
jgi:hypothetical protein